MAMSVVLLAASAIIPTATVRGPRGCGCAAPHCPQAYVHGEPGVQGGPATDRPEPSGGSAAHSPDASSMLGADGVVLKISFYRGIGAGVTSSYSRDGFGLTFETGVGVGGSFSAGTSTGRPDAGLSFEGRASMKSGFGHVRLPDFGATLAQDGRLQAYMDAKTGNFRTRFRSKPVHVYGEGGDLQAKAPESRRSWSLGTEFKLAAARTMWFSWSGVLDLVGGMFDTPLGGRGSRAPPGVSLGLPVFAVTVGGANVRPPFSVRHLGAEFRAGVADRFCAPKEFRAVHAIRVVIMRRFIQRRGASGARTPRSPNSPRGRSRQTKSEENHSPPGIIGVFNAVAQNAIRPKGGKE
ncbi:hypothetical protein D0T12_07390 [Actinomadura spongiicola]|uniref:Uncharacterized protein n=1 Tax=Actinomadura spongiicola TaxID=2303421 RepID=A0A372GLY4_9ACTN|nr:hypothetical protein [Actinomadura spongiicola]RFS86406.1 hypothetical protein D0T12_07390 [Actinomadura spongiicola]